MRTLPRDAMAVALAALAGLGALFGPPGAAAAAPNVLVVVTDDQRAGDMDAMPKTRREFWRRGREYGRAYATTPLCCPSRASIFTGRFAHNHGIHTNGSSRLPQAVTLQRYLDRAGYRTAIVGKYLNSWPLWRRPPHFDRWAIVQPDSYRGATFNVNGVVRRLRGYSTAVMSRRSVRLLRDFERRDRRPWFLYVAPVASHSPARPARRYARARVPIWRPNPAVVERDRADKPWWVRARRVRPETARSWRARQLRTLMSVDDLVGRVFAELRALGEGRRTLAVFTSDNGFLHGEHGLTGKRHPYTPSVRIPLALRWPGHVDHSRATRFATNLDIAPTILHAAGIDVRAPMDGRSLLASWRRRHVFMEFRGRARGVPAWDAIRTGRAQYVQYYDASRRRVVFREYYAVRRDRWQLRNLLADGTRANDPPTRRLARLIGRYRTCAGFSCP